MSARKRLVLNIGLAKLLGFARDEFEANNKKIIVDEPHRLAIDREICVHFAEISTSDILHNGRPSTLLRSVPVENEKCGGGRTEIFPILQYKRVASGAILQLTLMVLDVSGKQLSFDYLSATLYADQPKKKALFSRSLREQKFSNANFRGENSAWFRVSSRRPFFPLRDFTEKLRELSRNFSAKFRAATPLKLGVISKNILNFCFVWFVVLRPSQ